MGSIQDTTDVYGPGTYTDSSFTPLPQECRRLLKYVASLTPGFTQDAAVLDAVNFVGSDYPIMPGPIKSQAMAAVMHAMAGVVGQEILELRGEKSPSLTVDVDHAGLYCASPITWTADKKDAETLMKSGEYQNVVPSSNSSDSLTNPLNYRTQAIYPTRDPEVWFQLHGSTNPTPVLEVLGFPPGASAASHDEGYEMIKSCTVKYSARDLEMMMIEKGLCGSKCFTPEEWRQTLMGQMLARHPLINYNKQVETPDLPPIPFPKSADKRPLAGIKVVELARIIAAPACGQGLAAMGADVVRVQKREMSDLDMLQTNLTAGKTMLSLDITHEEDKKKLWDLIKDADVVIQGYRLGSLEHKGFGKEEVLAIANARKRGIIYIDENCYGPDGYFSERPGWQQIADAAAGSSYVIGRAYGFQNGECVLPSLPISDMCTGAVAFVTTLMALRDRAKFGGSYHGTAALTAYNALSMTKEVALYTPEVVAKIQEIWSFPKMTPDQHVIDLLLVMWRAWSDKGGLVDQEKFFVHFSDSVFGKDLKFLAPVVKYDDSAMTPHWTSPPKPYCSDSYRTFKT